MQIEAEILSNGDGPSTGIVVIDHDKAYYVPDIQGDTETLIDALIDALNIVATVDGVAGSGQAGAISALISELNTLKGNLK
jgi:cephalosporin-C deacetylase-like acetyl esterase